jgi:hypothetical protein
MCPKYSTRTFFVTTNAAPIFYSSSDLIFHTSSASPATVDVSASHIFNIKLGTDIETTDYVVISYDKMNNRLPGNIK